MVCGSFLAMAVHKTRRFPIHLKCSTSVTVAQPVPGCRRYEGVKEIPDDLFWTFTRGIEPETGRVVWKQN